MPKIKTTKDFIEDIRKIAGDRFELRSEYVKSTVEVLIYDTVCGNTFPVTPNAFFIGQCKCRACAATKNKEGQAERIKMLDKNFKDKAKAKFGDEYKILSTYTGPTCKVDVMHKPCGKEFNVIGNNLLHGSKCPVCFKNERIRKPLGNILGFAEAY